MSVFIFIVCEFVPSGYKCLCVSVSRSDCRFLC